MDLCQQSMSLLFNMLSRLIIAFLPRRKQLLISWLKSLTTVILEPRTLNVPLFSFFSPSICHEIMGLDTMILVFWMLSFKPIFSLSFFTFIKRLFSSSSLSVIRVYYLHIWGCWFSLWLIQSGILYHVLCTYVKYAKWQYIAWHLPCFSYFGPKNRAGTLSVVDGSFSKKEVDVT